MNLRTLLALILALALLGTARSQDVIHHGPSLDVQVQRGEARLPLSQVDRLRAGDRVMVRPDPETLARGDWVLLLARVSPRGNQIESRHFDVRALKGDAELEITADSQVPVIMLAPQLRNLFGLTTSLFESGRLLNEVLRADPQRFYDLQNADQINHAIRAISQGLARRLGARKPEQAIEETKALAARFGVRSVDPACFKNQSVNTECVATSIVANRDFALPSTEDLSAMVGPRKSADLNSFLTANLRVLTDAADYLGNRYRDTYDFAPTFGRRQSGSKRVELFSIARFRSGSIKTAYVYVPSWFTGPAPTLSPDRARMDCHPGGRLDVQVQGPLPLVDYWHGWRMSISDPGTRETLAEIDALAFDPETGRFRFAPMRLDPARPPSGNQVVVRISGRFGFDPVELEPIRMALPLRGAAGMAAALTGLDDLIAGERAALKFRIRDAGACVHELALSLPGGKVLRSEAETPSTLEADLRTVSPGAAELTVEQTGSEAVTVATRVLPPKARVTRIEHAEWEDSITIHGERLDRIARVEAGTAICTAPEAPEARLTKPGADGDAAASVSRAGIGAGDGAAAGTGATRPDSAGAPLRLACRGEVRGGARASEPATVFHQGDAPGPIRIPVTRTGARPRIDVATDTPNALLVTPSPNAQRWGLGPEDRFISEDSGVGLLLRARRPYVLARGSYQLQLRFRDDPQSDAHPLTAPLIADFAHDELRTRAPVEFRKAELPGIVNPLEYRVIHQPSGLAADWQALGRAVLPLPALQSAACSPQGDALWVQGTHLDLIEGTRSDPPDSGTPGGFTPARLVPCPSGLCLALPAQMPDRRLRVRLRWVDGRAFDVRLPKASPACPTTTPGPEPAPAASTESRDR